MFFNFIRILESLRESTYGVFFYLKNFRNW